MVATVAARRELVRRLGRVAEAFGELYPGVRAPEVFDGFPATEPPFYLSVGSVVDSLTTQGGATVGAARVEFVVPVLCFARMADQQGASEALLTYADAVVNAVLADPQLARTVDNALPSVTTAGTAADSSRRYMSAASVDVRCMVFLQCPQRFREVVA